MELFPKQEELRSRIEHSIAVRKSFVYEAGMRGGKTELARHIVRKLKKEDPKCLVYWVGTTADAAKAVAYDIPDTMYVGAAKLLDMIGQGFKVPLEAVFVLDDAFWMDRGEELFNKLTSGTYSPRVLAYGSRSDTPWQIDAYIPKFSTWEMNPDVSADDLAGRFVQDRKKAERDFGPLPKNG